MLSVGISFFPLIAEKSPVENYVFRILLHFLGPDISLLATAICILFFNGIASECRWLCNEWFHANDSQLYFMSVVFCM